MSNYCIHGFRTGDGIICVACLQIGPLPVSEGVKHDQGKEPLDLLSSEALLQLAKVLGYGASKYSSHNWRGGLAWSRVYSAVQRHLLKWNAGETIDPETGLNHLAHAMCGLMFLLQYAKSKPELDDRFVEKKT
jgi:Domain of unknown function (DUF5664)